MNRFHPQQDKSQPMTHVVSYHGVVPLERGLCYVLYLVGKHWPDFEHNPHWVLSASRDIDDVQAHNREFHTDLHSQQQLIDLHNADPEDNPPANPVDQTSHCLRSDGKPVYRTPEGHRAGAGSKIAWYQRGIDFETAEIAHDFCRRAGSLQLAAVQPYDQLSEKHHVVLAHSPIRVLIARNVIHPNRGDLHPLVQDMDEAEKKRAQPHLFSQTKGPEEQT